MDPRIAGRVGRVRCEAARHRRGAGYGSTTCRKRGAETGQRPLGELGYSKWTGPGGPPDAQDLRASLTTLIGRTGRAALTDGREAILRLDLDPKTVTVTAEVQLTAEPGAPWRRRLPSTGRRPTASPIWRRRTRPHRSCCDEPLFAAEIRTAADAILKRASGTADDHQPPVPAEFINALRRSVQAGELTFGAAVRGPDKDGRFTAVAGLRWPTPARSRKPCGR